MQVDPPGDPGPEPPPPLPVPVDPEEPASSTDGGSVATALPAARVPGSRTPGLMWLVACYAALGTVWSVVQLEVLRIVDVGVPALVAAADEEGALGDGAAQEELHRAADTLVAVLPALQLHHWLALGLAVPMFLAAWAAAGGRATGRRLLQFVCTLEVVRIAWTAWRARGSVGERARSSFEEFVAAFGQLQGEDARVADAIRDALMSAPAVWMVAVSLVVAALLAVIAYGSSVRDWCSTPSTSAS